MSAWFEVSRSGLAKILRRRGIEFAVFELIQNAWDEAGVTRVDVNLEYFSNGKASLTIIDNSTAGFQDLTHAFTLFADSAKKGNPEQRGRFNLGEKLVVALCSYYRITSSTGSIIFDEGGRRISRKPVDMVGTKIEATLKMSRQEVADVNVEVAKLIPPRNIETVYNGTTLVAPELVQELAAVLPTEIADGEGALRRSKRQTDVRTYRVAPGDVARIYEMGIPVVEHDCAFHVDVQQKIPLTLDRENVSVRFLRAIRVAVFNETHGLLSADEVTHEWAQTAVESPDVTAPAVESYMTKRFGEKRVSFDPSDPEANNKAVSHGFTLVHGGMLGGAAWRNAKKFETILPAGQVFPTHPGGLIPWEAADLTTGMIEVREYAKKLARILLDYEITVEFGKQPSREAACWGDRRLQFNVTNLGGPGWFNLYSNLESIDDLIIHEFGHHYESNHLSERYYDALTRLAAKAIQAAREGKI